MRTPFPGSSPLRVPTLTVSLSHFIQEPTGVQALIIVPASDAHLESKASALACRSKAEALDSSRPAPRLAGTMIKAGVHEFSDVSLS